MRKYRNRELRKKLEVLSGRHSLEGLLCKKVFYSEDFTEEDERLFEFCLEKKKMIYSDEKIGCYLQTTHITGQAGAIRTYGIDVWSWVCDEVSCGETFTLGFVVDNCPYLQHLKERTKKDYVAVILNNVVAEYEMKSEKELDGMTCPVKKINRRTFLMK